ncbi:hypothetical protein KXV53_002501 [Aspergillus fumigatus]|nr:hypothetical protein KXW47_007567 [Aspergillus fumigatus]KAH1988609.1 hypothetical protein KXV33_001025 [Aspergillus fumigatus]KAH2402292.1 hypothetical protein KXV53_002501 [Aspergillus fumigatus]
MSGAIILDLGIMQQSSLPIKGNLRNSIHPPLPETNLTSSSQTLPGWCKRDRPQPPGSTYLTHLYTGDGERGGLSKNLLLKGMIDSDRVRTLVFCTVVYDDSGSGDFERAYQETWRNDNGGIIATAAVAATMTARAAAAWAGTGAATVTATTATAAASAPTRTWHGDSKGPRAIFDDSHAGPRSVVNVEEAHVDSVS